jgi:hypothetical protein
MSKCGEGPAGLVAWVKIPSPSPHGFSVGDRKSRGSGGRMAAVGESTPLEEAVDVLVALLGVESVHSIKKCRQLTRTFLGR